MNDKKTKILEAASQLFLEGGLAALSVRAIAKQADVSTIGIYSHFQGKQGILDALYIEGFDLVSQAMEVLTPKRTGHKAVMAAAANYLDLAQSHKAHYKLIFGELNEGYQPSLEAKQAGLNAFLKLTEVVASLLPANTSAAASRAAALQVWALTHGFVSLQHHAVSQLMENVNWQEKTLAAIELHLKAIAEVALR